MTPLENSLILSYLHSKMSIKNLEVAVHELSVLNNEDAGKLQHKFEKLINAHRKAMGTMERNMVDTELFERDFEEEMNNNWNELLNK
jgi:hypothetical protein